MERTPLTFRLVSALCGVRDGEHAGQQSYLRSSSRSGNLFDSADELADIEDGWDEDDSWRDETQFFLELEGEDSVDLSLSQVSPAAEGIPGSSSSSKKKQIPRRRQKTRNHDTSLDTGRGADINAARGSADDLVCDKGGRPRSKRRRLRRIRNKAIIAATVLSQMLYAHNQSANAFQTIVAAYCFASQTGKRVTAVLNQLGLSVSPTTFASALKHNSSAACAVVKEGIQAGRKIGLFYDNLVIYDKKGEESEINKNRSLQLTACGGYFLQLPAESAEEINRVLYLSQPILHKY